MTLSNSPHIVAVYADGRWQATLWCADRDKARRARDDARAAMLAHNANPFDVSHFSIAVAVAHGIVSTDYATR